MSSIALDGPSEARKVFATYERSVQPKQYESEKAGLIVQAGTDVGDDEAAIERAAVGALQLAKANVLDQLGIEFRFENGKVLEGAGANGATASVAQVQAAFPGSQVVDPNPAPAPYQVPTAVTDHTAYQPQAQAAPPAAAPPQAQTAVGGAPTCPDCGGPMWDNREGKRNPKAPDFKCKRPRGECDGAIWPPR